jgi:formylglycine-generating enzyme required for sulfatase activity
LYSTLHRNDLEAEVEQLRQMSAAGEWQQLAVVLDRATVQIPAGEFFRGSNDFRRDERPQRRIYLDEFEIDRYEVTNSQFQRFLEAPGLEPPPYWLNGIFPSGLADYPVVAVTWTEANAYCLWAGKRLPTEAEWEKACRGPDGNLYPWGNEWDASRANVDPLAGSYHQTQPNPETSLWDNEWQLVQTAPMSPGSRGLRPVGSYPGGASPYGILDLAGNASEWVADWYNYSGYGTLPDENPFAAGPEWDHALRGSTWYDPTGSAAWGQNQSRCSRRNSSHNPRDIRIGFRCARSIP